MKKVIKFIYIGQLRGIFMLFPCVVHGFRSFAQIRIVIYHLSFNFIRGNPNILVARQANPRHVVYTGTFRALN